MHILPIDIFIPILLGASVDKKVFFDLKDNFICVAITISDPVTMADALKIDAGGRRNTSMLLMVFGEFIEVQRGQLLTLVQSLATSSELVDMMSKQVFMKI